MISFLLDFETKVELSKLINPVYKNKDYIADS